MSLTVGERIESRREQLGLKQYQVADSIGVTRTTMSKYENGVNIPNAEILAKLARVLQTSADYLCGLTDSSTPHGTDWVCTDQIDRQLITNIRKLSREDQLRISGRVEQLLEDNARSSGD